MSPREVIARAIYNAWHCREAWDELDEEDRFLNFDLADAVIDTLASMEPTDAMVEAYLDQTGDPLSEFGWSAAVGAMRDE